jgi:prepilin-type N-terminal cleavage/methylation domain-containing protein
MRHKTNNPAPGFTMLELQVALIVLGVCLMGLASLLAMHSRQLRQVEQWCGPGHPTYYLVSQTDRWMKQLGAPANMEPAVGKTPWVPPPADKPKYDVHLLSVSRQLDNTTLSATVELQPQ